MPNRRHRNYAPEGRPGLFTELFTVRYTVVTIGSAPGYGHSGSPSSSTGQEGGGGGCGGVLERRKFSPGIPEVISKTLKDTPVRIVRRGVRRVSGGTLLTSTYLFVRFCWMLRSAKPRLSTPTAKRGPPCEKSRRCCKYHRVSGRCTTRYDHVKN